MKSRECQIREDQPGRNPINPIIFVKDTAKQKFIDAVLLQCRLHYYIVMIKTEEV